VISPRIDRLLDNVDSNYLTIALEEVAQGKIKYHYR
jgi:DNA-directed RNA polymerase subunit K/omega